MDARHFLDATEEDEGEHSHRLCLHSLLWLDRASEDNAINAEQSQVAVRLTPLPWPHGNVYLRTAS
jgi:hypothetical protein